MEIQLKYTAQQHWTAARQWWIVWHTGTGVPVCHNFTLQCSIEILYEWQGQLIDCFEFIICLLEISNELRYLDRRYVSSVVCWSGPPRGQGADLGYLFEWSNISVHFVTAQSHIAKKHQSHRKVKLIAVSWYRASQGRIFPKIQPTTICRIERTFNKNQAKALRGSGLSTK